MIRHRSGFVLGFHGCDAAVAEAILGGDPMRISTRDYDWLGPGAYFWEGDADRAREWAAQRVAEGSYDAPAVIGAIIELGNCLDLTIRSHLDLLAAAHASLKAAFNRAGKPMPENRGAPKAGGAADKPLRYLDCAVIKHLHDNLEADAREKRLRGEVPDLEPFDTVRGLFHEGTQLYDGGGFYTHTHAQIAVRSTGSIRGFFRPR
ncbi:MAG: hypothetical protein B7Y36_07500 [Novosphingobium sp. 28-62-57]|nr:MAG: hypothetical protein B7Z34_01520 [Novosphingobium sp. 12-62-10]OYZ11187.1 MAG: hypothetical protein B7Y36_07500 [Novosphingobium sp. 28-62-57]OZA36244.1 MAG: hypothetical protein B7X92_07085 [Novosphingobium sp. 17-62-9]